MANLLIVGSGLAGSTLTRAARTARHRVTLIDLPPAPGRVGTDAALALLSPSYLPTEQLPLMQESLHWWETVPRAQIIRGALVSRWDDAAKLRASQADVLACKPRARIRDELRTPRHQGQWIAVDPAAARIDPDIWTDGEGILDFTQGSRSAQFDAIVLCDGHGPGRVTFGATWVNASPLALTAEATDGHRALALHHVAPYKTLAGVSFASGSRLGSSSASTQEVADAQALKFWEIATHLGWLDPAYRSSWQLIRGSRILRAFPEQLQQLSSAHHPAPPTFRWSGFHRTGFALVPALAPRILDQVLAASRAPMMYSGILR